MPSVTSVLGRFSGSARSIFAGRIWRVRTVWTRVNESISHGSCESRRQNKGFVLVDWEGGLESTSSRRKPSFELIKDRKKCTVERSESTGRGPCEPSWRMTYWTSGCACLFVSVLTYNPQLRQPARRRLNPWHNKPAAAEALVSRVKWLELMGEQRVTNVECPKQSLNGFHGGPKLATSGRGAPVQLHAHTLGTSPSKAT